MGDMPLSEAQLQAYRAENDRIGRLTEFVLRFAPSVGQRADGGYDQGDLLDEAGNPGITLARNDAIRAAFRAVERFALKS